MGHLWNISLGLGNYYYYSNYSGLYFLSVRLLRCSFNKHQKSVERLQIQQWDVLKYYASFSDTTLATCVVLNWLNSDVQLVSVLFSGHFNWKQTGAASAANQGRRTCSVLEVFVLVETLMSGPGCSSTELCGEDLLMKLCISTAFSTLSVIHWDAPPIFHSQVFFDVVF